MGADSLQGLLVDFEKDCMAVQNEHELVLLKSKYLGKKGVVSSKLASLGAMAPEQRAKAGRDLNDLKARINARLEQIQQNILQRKVLEPIDVSAPGKALFEHPKRGHLHPSSLVLEETFRVFTELGFAIVDSPEIETDWYNFEALNMPQTHPAREMQDTFYIKGSNQKLLPRTHTSGMQVRYMQDHEPPFKILVSGKVFRNENEDATHSWTFNQIEGLVVGEGVSMSDLKGTLLRIVEKQLGEGTEIRFRASYFPYTEPSVEVDAKYRGKWLELGGAGMVHPQVLKNAGIDSDKYTGFAFGWGVERLAVIKYGLEDLRLLWRPNIRYLEQF